MFDPVRVIERKRDGGELTDEQIGPFLAGFVAGSIPDYQMSALAMAIFLRDMTPTETARLTHHMLHSGDRLTWQGLPGPVVDKHSTGGVGDKVSLPLAPVLACLGLYVPMISGRGLGTTGGTLDKLEAIPGYSTRLSLEEIRRQVRAIGCVITGQTETLVPADKKLYALRDVTGTVPSIPLITASIMSKKLAEGLDALILDVKHGNGAFMKTLDDARRLARSMITIGQQLGVKTAAMLTDMNQPIGKMVGHANEIHETVRTLQGAGPPDLVELVVLQAAHLLVLTGQAPTLAEGRQRAEKVLASGAAYEKFAELVRVQGGNLDAPMRLAPVIEVLAATKGVVEQIDAGAIGYAVLCMGGGRITKEDQIDPAVGVEMLVRAGDAVERNQPLARLFVRPAQADRARAQLAAAITIGPGPAQVRPLIAAIESAC